MLRLFSKPVWSFSTCPKPHNNLIFGTLLGNHVLHTKYCLLVTKDYFNGDTLHSRDKKQCCCFKRKSIYLATSNVNTVLLLLFKNIFPKSNSHLLNSNLHNEVICKYNSSLFHERKAFLKINILPLLKMNYLDTYSNSYFISKFSTFRA